MKRREQQQATELHASRKQVRAAPSEVAFRVYRPSWPSARHLGNCTCNRDLECSTVEVMLINFCRKSPWGGSLFTSDFSECHVNGCRR